MYRIGATFAGKMCGVFLMIPFVLFADQNFSNVFFLHWQDVPYRKTKKWRAAKDSEIQNGQLRRNSWSKAKKKKKMKIKKQNNHQRNEPVGNAGLIK